MRQLAAFVYFAGDPSVGIPSHYFEVKDLIWEDADTEERERVRGIIKQAFADIEGEHCVVNFQDEEEAEQAKAEQEEQEREAAENAFYGDVPKQVMRHYGLPTERG